MALLSGWSDDASGPFGFDSDIVFNKLKDVGIVKGEVEAKILSNGEITKKIIVDGVKVSATAAEKIKAAGGISSMEDAEEFIRLGASRLGTSRIVKIVKAG